MSELNRLSGLLPAQRGRMDGLSRGLGRALERVEARAVLGAAEEQLDAYVTHTAMDAYHSLVQAGSAMSDQQPDAAAGLALLCQGFVQRAHRRGCAR